MLLLWTHDLPGDIAEAIQCAMKQLKTKELATFKPQE